MLPLVWHDHPDQALSLICRKLEIIKKKSGVADFWKAVRHLLQTDMWFTMRIALEWAWLDEDLVGHELIKHLAENHGQDTAALLPRGHGKTLPMSAFFVTQIIRDPNIALLELSRTDDNASKFGALVADHLMYNEFLQRCFGRKYNKNGFLPSALSDCNMWGKDGYALPWRKPRLDPTVLAISLKAAIAGKHPDIIYVDDPTEAQNNDPSGWAHVENTIDGLKMLLPPDGFFIWTGTRWHDGDPLGKVERGKLIGKQGPFKVLKRSCYVDDQIQKAPTYPRKKRWNMQKETGYTHEALELMRKPKEEGGLGEFFDAQMRNDPAPAERADIKVKDICLYNDDNLPKVSNVKLFGIETTGGGLPIYNGFREYLDELKLGLPIVEIVNPRKLGVTKRDRIVATIQPITNAGKLFCKDWMIGDDSATEGLGYELRRIGKASNDDIADALHNIPAHLSKGILPSRPTDPADLYISADLAWSEEKRADWTVVIAVAIDYRGNHYVLDYDRFQISSPTGLYTRLLSFYQKFEEPASRRKRSARKFAGSWR